MIHIFLTEVMHMKKLLAILMALALVVCCFAACGGGEDKPTGGDKTATPITIEGNVIKIGVFAFLQPSSCKKERAAAFKRRLGAILCSFF